MYDKKYKLRYLPLFYEDLDEKITYIAEKLKSWKTEKLKNPKAASDLLNKVEKAIRDRFPAAEFFEPYHSIRERKYAYYRIYVVNFIIYYVVIDDDDVSPIMEVRRFLYSRQDQQRLV